MKQFTAKKSPPASTKSSQRVKSREVLTPGLTKEKVRSRTYQLDEEHGCDERPAAGDWLHVETEMLPQNKRDRLLKLLRKPVRFC